MYAQEGLLIKELKSLKVNVENLFQHCQCIENENKVLKRIAARPNQSLSAFSYGKGSNFVENLMNKRQSNKYFSKAQNSDYFTEILRQSQNSQRIQDLKSELTGLSNNLKSMSKMFDKYELDSTNSNQSKDFLVSESSFNALEKRAENQSSNKSPNQEIDLQTLICHEELSFDGNEFQKKENTTEYSDRGVVDSLIAKGIQFRESRALMSKQFKNLSNIIQQYRSQFQPFSFLPNQKSSITLKYR